jgi:hypothetical protein
MKRARDYFFQFDSHVTERVLYFALHEVSGAPRPFARPWSAPLGELVFSPRAMDWRESVENST